MHRLIIGTCRFDLTLTPLGPWLVRGESVRMGRSEVLQPLLEPASRGNPRPMLPGSGLKGVLRSTAERILRTVDEQRSAITPLADATFIHDVEALKRLGRHEISDSELHTWAQWQDGADWKQRLAPHTVYKHLSAASQLFGATPHAGFVHIEDAYGVASQRPRRSHVAIDRVTGGVGEGPFVEELAPSDTPLATSLTVSNFALWQLGLLALVFQEINRGYVAIGGGTRKGQGRFCIDVPRVTFTYAACAYKVPSGIISAQVHTAEEPFYGTDVPDAVLRAERDMVLLAKLNIDPQPRRDWRDEGQVRLIIQEGSQVKQLFRESVERAWVSWLEEMRQ